jgi:YceI-like domain
MIAPAFLALALLLDAGQPRVLVRYELNAGARPIVGTSDEVEWIFSPLGEHRAHMRLRVPIDSFLSGDRKFDQALRKAIDSERHPFLVVEGIATTGQLDGTLDFAGSAQKVSVVLHSERSGDHVLAVASFAVDLREFGIALEAVDARMSFDAVVWLVESQHPPAQEILFQQVVRPESGRIPSGAWPARTARNLRIRSTAWKRKSKPRSRPSSPTSGGGGASCGR